MFLHHHHVFMSLNVFLDQHTPYHPFIVDSELSFPEIEMFGSIFGLDMSSVNADSKKPKRKRQEFAKEIQWVPKKTRGGSIQLRAVDAPQHSSLGTSSRKPSGASSPSHDFPLPDKPASVMDDDTPPYIAAPSKKHLSTKVWHVRCSFS